MGGTSWNGVVMGRHLRICRKYPLPRRNKQALKSVQQDQTHIVVPTDKNMGWALIEKNEYNNRIQKELEKAPDSFRKMQLENFRRRQKLKCNFEYPAI